MVARIKRPPFVLASERGIVHGRKASVGICELPADSWKTWTNAKRERPATFVQLSEEER